MTAQLPVLDGHVARDTKLREGARRIAASFLDWADLARTSLRENDWARFKFDNPRAYFEERCGVSYRTVRRGISVLEACEELPSPDCRQAREAMAGLGIRKAAIVAPAIRAEPDKWERWHARAVKSRVEALQEAVNRALGRETPGASDPGEAILRRLKSCLPEDRGEWAEAVIRAGLKVSGGKNPTDMILMALELLAQDLAAQGIEVTS